MSDRWVVKPGSRVDLTSFDTAATPGAPGGKPETEAVFPSLHAQLIDLQERLWAEHRRSVLVVLQALDAGGKDGTIKHVFGGVNPQGTRVVSFKEPTPIELAHDFLWRIHAATPAAGEIVIFNRSHYEDVLAVRVRGLVPEKVWRARYALINGFEELLARDGTTIVKLCLQISKEEQRRRLQERIDRPDKRWKFQLSDLEDRKRWDDYLAAYASVLEKTSTKRAPWHLIPADHKWYRNWAVSTILIDALKQLNPQYPAPPDLSGVRLE